MANRDVTFIIKTKYEVTKGLDDFSAEINQLKLSIKELNQISSQKTGLKNIENSVKNLRQFMKGLGKSAQNEAKYFQAFERVAESFNKVASASTFAGRNIKAYGTIVDQVVGLGKKIGSEQEAIDAAAKAMGFFGKQIQAMGKAPTEKIEKLGTLFRNMSEAAGRLTLGGLKEALESISASSGGLKVASVAVCRMTRCLGRGGVADSATALARMGGAMGAAGGAATFGGGFGGYGGFPWGSPLTSGEGAVFRTFKEGFGRLGEEKVDVGVEASAQKFIDTIRKGNQHINEYLQRMFEKPSGAVAKAIMKIQQSQTGTTGIVSATGLASLISGKTFGEGVPGQAGFIGMARGTTIHLVTENIMKYIETVKGGIGNFLKSRAFMEEDWANLIKQEANRAAKEFQRLALEGARAAGTQITDKEMKKIRAASKQVYNEIMIWGSKKRGLFAQLYNYMAKDLGMDASQIAKATVELEKDLAPLRLIKPGTRTITRRGKAIYAGAKIDVPKEIRPQAVEFVRDAISRLRIALGEDSAEFKEIMSLIRQFGLTITGTADMVISMGEGLKKIIVDLKTGTKVRGPQVSHATQLGTYGMAAAGGMKQLPELFTYLSAQGKLQQYGPGIKAPAAATEEVKIVKEKVKASKEVNEAVRETAALLKVTRSESEAILAVDKNREIVAEKTTQQVRQQAETRTTGRGQPPPGQPPPMQPPTGGGPPFDPTVAASYRLVARSLDEGALALTRYSQELTTAYLRQKIMGERIDLSRVMMTEYDRIVNKLSRSMSRYVEIGGLSAEIQDKQGMEYQETAHYLDRISDLMDKYSTGLERAKNLEGERTAQLRKLSAAIASTTEGGVQAKGIREVGKLAAAGDPTAWKKLDVAFRTNVTMGERLSATLKDLISNHEKLSSDILENEGAYKHFTSGLQQTIQIGERAGGVISKEDIELKKMIDGLKLAHPELNKLAAETNDVVGAVNFLEAAMRKQRLAMLSNVGTEEEVRAVLAKLDKRFSSTGASATSYTQSVGKASLGLEILNQNQRELTALIDRTKKAIAGQTAEMERLEKEERQSAEAVKVHARERERLNKIQGLLHSKLRTYTEDIARMGEIQRQQMGRTAEHFRGTIRTTLKGFADMLKSQSAWIAGYAVMFGALRGFRSALGSVVTITHEFARAMRTARSEMMTTAQILYEYRSVGIKAMIEFGKEAKDVGEVLYQLGSAGLTASESLAALDSAMNALVGTEGDVTETTKLIASVYNNFGKEIKTATGLVGKFQYINDVMVATFRDHQVEMNELREGYKYLIAMGKVANLTFLQMSGILATLNDHLIKSGIAGRSVQTILSRISRQPTQFAEAFDIRIDPNEPLNFIKILTDINKRIGENRLTVEDIGKIFERLGLRGARSFTLLVQHVGELTRNIELLKLTSSGAAEDMARVMLEKPDVAFRRMKQTLAELIRLGFSPLVKAAYGVSLAVSTIGISVSESNKYFKEFGKALVQLIGLVATLSTASVIFRVLGKRLSRDTADWQTLSEVLHRVQVRFRTIRMRTVGLITSFIKLDRLKMEANFNRLGKAIAGSVFAFKALLVVVAAYLSYKLIDYLHTSSEEYVALAGKIAEATNKTTNEIAAIEEKIKAYGEMNENMRETVELLRQQQKIKAGEFLANLPESFKKTQEASTVLTNQLNAFMKGFEDVEKGVENFFKDTSALEIGPIGGKEAFRDFENDIRRQAGLVIKLATSIQSQIIRMQEQLTLEGVPEAVKIAIKTVYLPQYKKMLEDLNKASAEAFKKLKVAGFEEAAPTAKVMPLIVTGEFDVQRVLKESLSQQSNYIQLLEQRSDIEERLANLAYIRKAVSDDEVNVLEGLGTSKEKIRDIGLDILKDQMATLIAQKDMTKANDEAFKLVKQLLDLYIKIGAAERQRERTIQNIVRSYEDLSRNISRATVDLAKSVMDLGALQNIFQIDEAAARKVQDFMRNINRYIEGLDPQPEDAVRIAMERLGVATKEGAKAALAELVKEFEKFQKIQTDILKDRAMYQYLVSLTKVQDTHRDKLKDIAKQMTRYRSVQETIGDETYNLEKQTREYVYRVGELTLKIREQYGALALSIKNKKDDADLIRMRIKGLEKELDLTKKQAEAFEALIPILLDKLHIDTEISRAQEREAKFMETYTAMIETRMPKALSFLKKAIEERQFAERASFEEIAADHEKLGYTTEQIEKMRTALIKKHAQERKFIELKYIQDSLQAQQQFLSKNAELLMRNMENIKDFWKASKEAMKAGLASFYIEYENVAKSIEEITTRVAEGMTDAFTESLILMVKNSEDTSEQIKEVFYNLFQEISSMIIKAGLAKLIGNLIGGVLGGALGAGAGAGAGAGTYTPGSFAPGYKFQKGGYIFAGMMGKRGIPILAHKGEYVIPADSVDYYGRELFDRLRRKEIIKMQQGGMIEEQYSTRRTTSSGMAESSGASYKEGDTVNYVTIKTNDVDSFRQALYNEKDFINALVIKEQRNM